MKKTAGFGIAGTKYYIPEKRIPIEAIIKEFNLDRRLVKNIGIEQIFETETETPSEMGLKTAKELLQDLNMPAKDLDMLIYSTNLPEKLGWSGSAKISYELGLTAFPSLDIYQGCNSILAAMDIACKYFQGDKSINNIIYITADRSPIRYLPGFSFYTHGAGAMIFSRDASKIIPLSTLFIGDGTFADHLYVVGGLNGPELGGKVVDVEQQKKEKAEMQMNIFNSLIKNSEVVINKAIEKASCAFSDIDLFIPNNTTKAVPLFLKELLKLDEEKIFVDNIPPGRHIGAADLIINMHDIVEQKKTKQEMKACLISYAGGFYWGASVLSIN